MPQYVNDGKLPQALADAIQHFDDDFVSSGSHIGASGLGAPARQIALLRKHDADIVIPVSSRMFMLFGKAMHVVLERAARADRIEVFAEERWEIERAGWRVAARCDHLSLKDGVLTDYKVTSVWSVKDPEPKPEWVAQLNVTRRVAPEPIRQRITALAICALLRDYRKNEKLRYGDDYPDAEQVMIPIPLWSDATVDAYLDTRLAAHQAAQAGTLPLCTAEERWEKPTIYAVTKRGRKSAIRLYETRALAEQHAASGADLEVQVRVGESPRCAQYCDALPFCSQGQALVAQTEAAKAAS